MLVLLMGCDDSPADPVDDDPRWLSDDPVPAMEDVPFEALGGARVAFQRIHDVPEGGWTLIQGW